MKVKELIKQLQELPQEDDIVITAMDDHFFETEFEVHSPYEDGQAQEIIINAYMREDAVISREEPEEEIVTIQDLCKLLTAENLADFLQEYNKYVQEFHETHDTGSTPVSIMEFYNNDYFEV